jgi:hypothetical protein
VPGTCFTSSSTLAPIRSISWTSAPKIFTPTGVRIPVESMSRRFLIGIVHAFVVPGIWSFAFISSTSLSCVRPRLHWDAGFKTTVVSIIENGAGSVAVSARPAFPKTRSTSGKLARTRSCSPRSRDASVTERPGSVVGM